MEVEELRARLDEAEATLRAIRQGEVDAVVIDGAAGPQVYTLQSADRPYRIIVERMQEGALTLSPDGTVLYANRYLASLLNLPLDNVIGQPFQRFVAEADQLGFARLLADSANGGSRDEIELHAADGPVVPVYLSAVDLPEERQRIISVILTNLTLHKQRTRELAESNAQLAAALAERERAEHMLRHAQKMEAMGQLTAGIAHDFNNLLTVIGGNLDLIQERAADERLKRQLESVQRALRRSVRLTDQLLAFSRQRALRPRPIFVNDLLRDTESLLRHAVGDEIKVKLVFSEDVGQCLVDSAEFQASLLNLAINSKDAMPGGGSLTITSAETAIERGASDPTEGLVPGVYVMIAVTDTGHGMSQEVRERAFDPFFTTKGVAKGTGLGLSQVYGFMRQSGGHVTIESEVGGGTTIRLYLPRTDASPMPEMGVQPNSFADAPKALRILVVEDDPDVRMFVTRLLEEAGHTVVEAGSGPAALRALEDDKEIDVVFTDVRMPDGMSGIELAQEIERRLPRIAVLLTSGFPAAFSDLSRETQGDWPILRKPFRREEVVQAIEEALKQHAAPASAVPVSCP